MSDEETGSENYVHTLTENSLEVHASFFNAKSEECVMLDKEGMQHEITNSSKIRDVVLRVASMSQVIEISLIFLDKHPDFIKSKDMSQPILPDATKYNKNKCHIQSTS